MDPELAAMHSVLRTMQGLNDPGSQQRVIDWVVVRLGLSGPTKPVRGALAQMDSIPEFESTSATPLREGTINTVVGKTGANSCRTLLIAAAAYLALYRGKEKFSRDELVSCAKEARLWKSDYGVQTSLNISRMCDAGELIEKAKDIYDLAPKKMAELEAKLAE